MSAEFIADAASLAGLCARLRPARSVTLDTEFRRVDTYYAQLCLIQVATAGGVACIDALAAPSLAPLLEILEQPGTLKVLHAARQDLEVLHDLCGRVPAPVFDTQIAAAFAGFADQVGYATLVQALTGEALDKSQTRTDWSRRPLTAAQLAYAADDVRHLRTVYRILDERLRALGRLAWLEEECAALTDPALYRVDPQQAFRRIGQGAGLSPAEQTRLRALAAWREQAAQAANRPRGWIFKDHVLVAVARQQPGTLEELTGIEDVSPGAARKWGRELLAVLQASRALPVASQYRPPVRFTPAQQDLLRELAGLCERAAARLNVPTTLLATRQDLQALLLGEESRVLRGWRRDAIGEELAHHCHARRAASA